MASIAIKINVEVPEGEEPAFTAHKALHQMFMKGSNLESWQPIHAAIGTEQIGECLFEVIKDDN